MIGLPFHERIENCPTLVTSIDGAGTEFLERYLSLHLVTAGWTVCQVLGCHDVMAAFTPVLCFMIEYYKDDSKSRKSSYRRGIRGPWPIGAMMIAGLLYRALGKGLDSEGQPVGTAIARRLWNVLLAIDDPKPRSGVLARRVVDSRRRGWIQSSKRDLCIRVRPNPLLGTFE